MPEPSSLSTQQRQPVTLIIGCGDVGCRLALQLLANDHLVYGLRRDSSRLPNDVIPIIADLTSDDLGEWPDYIDYVVYSAAANGQTEQHYRSIYLNGLQRVINRIQSSQLHPRRVFFTSSTAVYHQQDGEWVDEHSATQPHVFQGQIMLAAEQQLLNGEIPATVVRFGGIYGPGRHYMLQRVANGEVYGETPVIYGNRIHADDCAGLLAHLIALDAANTAIAPLYLGVDSAPVALSEVSQWLAQELAVTPQTEISGRRLGSKCCSNQRIVASGYQFQYPSYKEGYRRLIQEWLQNKSD